MSKSVGERLFGLERELADLHSVVSQLNARVAYMDSIQRAWIDREGVERVQAMVNELAAKTADKRRAEIASKIEAMLAAGTHATSLEVGERSIISLQVEEGPVFGPQLVRASDARPLVGAKVGDLVGKYRILACVDPVGEVADA